MTDLLKTIDSPADLRRLQRTDLPQGIKHQRWVWNFQQGGGVVGVTQGDQGACNARLRGRLQPAPSVLTQFAPARGRFTQRLGLQGRDDLAQGGFGLLKDGAGLPPGGQQAPRRFGPRPRGRHRRRGGCTGRGGQRRAATRTQDLITS